MSNFADTTQPLGQLAQPGTYGEEVRAATQEALGAIGEIDAAFNTIVGWSPAQELLEWVGGNWGQLLSLRDAWDSVALASDDLGKNLVHGSTQLDQTWGGRAAQAFDAHMAKWEAAFQQNYEACIAIRDKLTDLAENAKQIVDQIIQTILTVASMVMAALASFYIPVYGQARAIQAIWQTIKLINDVRKVVTAFIQMVKLAVEFFQSMTEIMDDKTPAVQVNVPQSQYAVPGSR